MSSDLGWHKALLFNRWIAAPRPDAARLVLCSSPRGIKPAGRRASPSRPDGKAIWLPQAHRSYVIRAWLP
jgi:hypothetical protein